MYLCLVRLHVFLELGLGSIHMYQYVTRNVKIKTNARIVIPDFYSAGLKYGHINEIWPT